MNKGSEGGREGECSFTADRWVCPDALSASSRLHPHPPVYASVLPPTESFITPESFWWAAPSSLSDWLNVCRHQCESSLSDLQGVKNKQPEQNQWKQHALRNRFSETFRKSTKTRGCLSVSSPDELKMQVKRVSTCCNNPTETFKAPVSDPVLGHFCTRLFYLSSCALVRRAIWWKMLSWFHWLPVTKKSFLQGAVGRLVWRLPPHSSFRHEELWWRKNPLPHRSFKWLNHLNDWWLSGLINIIYNQTTQTPNKRSKHLNLQTCLEFLLLTTFYIINQTQKNAFLKTFSLFFL